MIGADMVPIELDGNSLTLDTLELAARGGVSFVLSQQGRDAMRRSRDLVERFVSEGRTVYGITTGFGVFSEVAIRPDQSRELQRNLILSHCAGVGEPYSSEVVRVMMLLRANALARGVSGIRPAVVDVLLRMLSEDAIPMVPSQGSVGASGDLAPLAQLAAALMGFGRVRLRGEDMPADAALQRLGLEKIEYEAKEGLAMINGTQAICAVGGLAIARAQRLLDVADAVAAMTLDALKGTDAAFDDRIQQARPHPGQILVAGRMRALLRGSGIRESHRDCGKVQDAYSLRCIPQVHGAVRDAIDFAAGRFNIEINSATDNPLVFDDVSISGGNFHGAPVALACDVAAIALTDLASISERRIERLVNPDLSELPGFLTEKGGLCSGFMIAQVTAAALVSESKALSHPASVDSIPTSANKEDHVSMGPTAAWKLSRIVTNLEYVLAIELLAAAQAMEFHRPHRSSAVLEELHAAVRSSVAAWDDDRYLQPDIEAARDLLHDLAPIVAQKG